MRIFFLFAIERDDRVSRKDLAIHIAKILIVAGLAVVFVIAVAHRKQGALLQRIVIDHKQRVWFDGRHFCLTLLVLVEIFESMAKNTNIFQELELMIRDLIGSFECSDRVQNGLIGMCLLDPVAISIAHERVGNVTGEIGHKPVVRFPIRLVWRKKDIVKPFVHHLQVPISLFSFFMQFDIFFDQLHRYAVLDTAWIAYKRIRKLIGVF